MDPQDMRRLVLDFATAALKADNLSPADRAAYEAIQFLIVAINDDDPDAHTRDLLRAAIRKINETAYHLGLRREGD
jgi:hypothetical protein